MNLANTAFVLIASILVLFMTPGLAFFYGGLVTAKNVVNTMLSVFIMTGVAILLWISLGYTMAFSGDILGVVGNLKHVFMAGINLASLTPTKIPVGVYSLFQMMFAIITPALFVGAIVGRIRFKFLLAFLAAWSILIYYPMVHLVWSPTGWLAKLGVLDFAGGTVVHINAGVTALVLSVWLGRRLKVDSQHHYNLPWVLLGTAILWIGWYGFNAGSALAINSVAVQAALTSTIATGTAMVVWMGLDIWTTGKPTLVGVCTGTLCGLVGITPAAGYVTLLGSIAIGGLAAITSFCFVNVLKPKLGVDDALDAFGCHGVSGIVGSILTGVFATKSVNSAVTTNGLAYGGGFHLLGIQLLATAFTIIFVAAMGCLLIYLLRLVMPMRVNATEEKLGLDQGEHGERADYTIGLSERLSTYTADQERYANEFKGQLQHLQHHSSTHSV
ncbi:ammonia permease [Levilactobacillus namurensis DSM 19117]|uniref:Ammonium transporter n=1 Tax=Levilactobacillus namurensis DSM 19117 TaxID=1423773 RepID=A0A0R1K1N8_9LACO|nr:ammonium transporter [Levilactobacillus namurensis]KRK77052.1 ammonia permease [Levilactobacillus namurensis DSM 19117]GEO74148.1 ammonium transporter [Levilactobacillus namurensis]